MYSTHNEGKPISAEGFRRTMNGYIYKNDS